MREDTDEEKKTMLKWEANIQTFIHRVNWRKTNVIKKLNKSKHQQFQTRIRTTLELLYSQLI